MMDTRIRAIRPKDLLFVVLYGLFLPVILGFLFGLIDYYLQSFVSISFGYLFLWVMGMNIGNLVRKQYENPHVIYSILTGVGILISASVILATPTIWAVAPIQSLSDVPLYLTYYFYNFISLFNPVVWVSNFGINFVLELLIIGVGTYLGIKRTL